MTPTSPKRLRAALLGLAALLVPALATAQIVKSDDRADVLGSLAKVDDRLYPNKVLDTVDNVHGLLATAVERNWADFRTWNGEWTASIDHRNGRIEAADGAGVPWIPGRGNRLTLADIAADLGGRNTPDLATLESIARRFIDGNKALLGIDNALLQLDRGRSTNPSDYLWFVDFNVVREGMIVEGSRVVFRVNHGNLIQFGTEYVPGADVAVPPTKVAAKDAYEALSSYIGGFNSLTDKILDPGSLHLIVANAKDERYADGFAFGQGYGLVKVWEFKFRRAGVVGTWRARVDATSGEVTEFVDVNEYGQATGGVLPNGSTTAATRAMPFANLSTGGFSNSAGLFTAAAPTSTLNGQYVQVSDGCGAISLAASGGNLNFSTNTGTDCATPGVGGAGNTRAARTQFYWLNRIKEVGRSWLPANTWLNAKLVAQTNISAICNAYWDGVNVKFYRASAPCNNTGEVPGVSIHEYGHGLDSNDGNGSSPENGTGETIGDFTAALALHSSCVGPGFLSSNCSGYGDACTACTGVRDIDWAKRVSNVAHTVNNYTRTTCPQPSANNPNYVGVCGRDAIARGVTANKREGHCESYISSEALWDLPNRDLPSPGTGSAWTITDRLWYLSRSTGTQAFSCNTSAATWTSDGCNTGSLFKVFRAVDDDDGNLANGTPHGGAIFAAFNRHGIACATDAGANVTFAGCTPPAAPTLTLTPGNNSVSASWTASGSSVYDLYRNESGCNAGFTKVVNDGATTSFGDTNVANGTTYYYQVVAHPSGSEACGGAPSTCVSAIPVSGGGGNTPPTVTISAPATGSSFTSGTSVTFTGTATDVESGTLTAGMTWTSSINGAIGTGGSFSTSTLSNGTHTITASATDGGGLTGSASISITINAAAGVLTNGVPVTGLAGATGSQTFYTLAVPAGATNLSFTTSGGTGDLDLYVRFGAAPTTTVRDCASEGGTNAETCSFPAPSTGTYHVLVYGFAAYSGATLTGSYTAPGGSVTVTFYSIGAEDGRIWESGETTGVGAAGNSTDNNTTAIRVGDTNVDEQYRSIVSFDTSSIPDTATITAATIRLVRASLSGTSPFTTHTSCVADISTGGFGGNAAFAVTDFEAAATAANVATLSAPASNGSASTGTLSATGRGAISKTAKTQFRLYCTLDDNDDLGFDYVAFYPGENATNANKPQLTVTYTP
ncbi:MAG: pre-peptidase C-terminal domain-containing protein [Thermoanaerobaculia bacterium]|nr:pre-peptidase C-terminal domain-containing protein [Thermoanaerobaculia bacterium]